MLQALSHITIPNFLIVAIDTKLRDYLQEKGINVYYKDIQVCTPSVLISPCRWRVSSYAGASMTAPFRCSCSFASRCICLWHIDSRAAERCDAERCKCTCSQISLAQKDTGSNHAISALKFKIIKEFLDLGYNVLLSDIDIVWLDVSLPILITSVTQ